jgi:hypothetical protein
MIPLAQYVKSLGKVKGMGMETTKAITKVLDYWVGSGSDRDKAQAYQRADWLE